MAAGPSAEAALVAILTQGSPNPVAALVGTRVYALQLPQNPIYPAMVYTTHLNAAQPIPHAGRPCQVRQPALSAGLLVAGFRDGDGAWPGCVWLARGLHRHLAGCAWTTSAPKTRPPRSRSMPAQTARICIVGASTCSWRTRKP